MSILSAAIPPAHAASEKQSTDPNPGHLKMALVDMKCLYSDTTDATANHKNIQANIARHMYFVDKLAAEGAEFIGFPEASINGYHYSANMTWLSKDGPEVQAFRDKAQEKGVYISAGLAEIDSNGKKWETQFVVDPQGSLIAWYHKIWLTKERGLIESGSEHPVFEVKGVKMGISICADGSDFRNLKALADNGAKIIYGPHANTTGGTLAGWYNFRSKWSGDGDGRSTLMKVGTNGEEEVEMPSGGWIKQLGVYAALHNHAGLYNSNYDPPVDAANDKNTGWAAGAEFIGPDGKVLAMMPTSTNRADCKEFVLVYNIPLAP
jgi:hypothetical protein